MNIIEKIKFEEGDKAKMYKCPAGKWTIGAGINLEQQEMPQDVRDLWLGHIVAHNEEEVSMRYHVCYGDSFEGLPKNVRIVLQDMAYQMGINGLFNFVKMLYEIRRGDFHAAADELLDSNYARQTPERAKRNADLLRGCA